MQWALRFSSIVALLLARLYHVQLLFVVSANSGSNIGFTAIAHFHIISVEYFAQACFLEMPINLQEKFCSHICLNVTGKWWVEPNNIPFASSFHLRLLFSVLYSFIVTACGKCIIVHLSSLLEYFFIHRDS